MSSSPFSYFNVNEAYWVEIIVKYMHLVPVNTNMTKWGPFLVVKVVVIYPNITLQVHQYSQIQNISTCIGLPAMWHSDRWPQLICGLGTLKRSIGKAIKLSNHSYYIWKYIENTLEYNEK